MKKHNTRVAVRIATAFFAVIMLTLSCFAEESNAVQTKPQKCYELITSSDPEYYSKISIKSHSIVIEGCYADDKVTDITLKNCGTVSSTLKVNEDGTFSSVINPSDPVGNSDELTITLKSKATLKYRIMYDGNWFFPDNDLAEKNSTVLDNAISTSAKSWVGYVTDEQTEESVNQTLNEVAYLADYIAGDINDEYDKLKAISAWVSENIYYDRDAKESSVTRSTICIKNVLKERRTVCAGYAALFSALCEAQGIYTVNVRGTVTSDSISYEELADGAVNHEWCAAYIKDRWVWIDCVWDSGKKYANGQYYDESATSRMYFDISPLALSFNHCAYLAEKRYYFRAGEYFDTAVETTQESVAETISSVSSVISADTQSTVFTTPVPETYTAPESYSPSINNIESDAILSNTGSDNTGIVLIVILSAFIVIGLAVNIVNIIKIKKNK